MVAIFIVKNRHFSILDGNYKDESRGSLPTENNVNSKGRNKNE